MERHGCSGRLMTASRKDVQADFIVYGSKKRNYWNSLWV